MGEGNFPQHFSFGRYFMTAADYVLFLLIVIVSFVAVGNRFEIEKLRMIILDMKIGYRKDE